jgi:hypothetical protein
MDKLLGREIDMAEVEDRIEVNFIEVFDYAAAEAEPRAVASVSNAEFAAT